MNTTSEPPRPMSRQQLRAIVYKIAVSYLEVERGLRPREQLAAFLSPAEYRRHLVMPPVSATPAGPVRPPDIARVRVDSRAPDRVRASALVRRADDRWSNLLVDLHQVGRGWQVTKLDRLERIVAREPRHLEPAGEDLARRIDRVEGELALAVAARAAVKARIDNIGDRRTRAARQLRPELDRWTRRIEELKAEGDDLHATHRWRPEHELATSHQARKPSFSARDDERATGLLGPRPADPADAETWDGGAAALRRFRQRWRLKEDEPVLGPATSDDEQKAERQQLLERLREAAQCIGDPKHHDGHVIAGDLDDLSEMPEL